MVLSGLRASRVSTKLESQRHQDRVRPNLQGVLECRVKLCSGGQHARAVRAERTGILLGLWASLVYRAHHHSCVPPCWDRVQYQAEQASRSPPATTQMRQEMIASRLPPANSAIGGYFGLNRHERRGTQQIRAISVHRRETCDWIIGKGQAQARESGIRSARHQHRSIGNNSGGACWQRERSTH
jgi:hypothetical protein